MKHNNHTFIDSKTYEIIPDENIIEVDDEIAEAISILNKKGYKTQYCCGGHIKNMFKYDKQICDISLLDEEKIKQDFIEYFISNISDTKFSLISPIEFTSIYIKFDKDYNFEYLPAGFTKSPAWDDNISDWSKENFDTIEHKVPYYEKKIVRKVDDVHNEIIKYNKLLVNWANKLPDINERNDKYE